MKSKNNTARPQTPIRTVHTQNWPHTGVHCILLYSPSDILALGPLAPEYHTSELASLLG